MNESRFQAHLIRRIKDELPGALVLKNDSDYLQGIPDLLILYRRRWAVLEVKARATSRSQPNQDYYIELLGQMSFAAFIYPENEDEVLDALQQALRPRRRARVS